MDRPEHCKASSKLATSEPPIMTNIGNIPIQQVHPHPVMTLSLQSIPLHHQIHTQARIASSSPAPAQTPPLHVVPDMTQSPLHQHIISRGVSDFLSITSDMNTEVDSIDPSIMDFALQGRLLVLISCKDTELTV